MSILDRDRLRALISERGLTPRALSRALGDNPYVVRDILAGKSRNPRSDTLASIAQALDVPLSEILSEDGIAPTSSVSRPSPLKRKIPVVGEVAAGLWREAMPFNPNDATEFLGLDVESYDQASLYALVVVGRSMDLVYPPGRYVIVAPVAETGLRVGDYVIVERYRAGLVETTIKELVIKDGKAWLWPHSTQSEHQQPVLLDGDPASQDNPRVVGVVVADYGRRVRPPATFDLPRPNPARRELVPDAD